MKEKKQYLIHYNWGLRWQQHWFGWCLRKTGQQTKLNKESLRLEILYESWSWLWFTFVIEAKRS